MERCRNARAGDAHCMTIARGRYGWLHTRTSGGGASAAGGAAADSAAALAEHMLCCSSRDTISVSVSLNVKVTSTYTSTEPRSAAGCEHADARTASTLRGRTLNTGVEMRHSWLRACATPAREMCATAPAPAPAAPAPAAAPGGAPSSRSCGGCRASAATRPPRAPCGADAAGGLAAGWGADAGRASGRWRTVTAQYHAGRWRGSSRCPRVMPTPTGSLASPSGVIDSCEGSACEAMRLSAASSVLRVTPGRYRRARGGARSEDSRRDASSSSATGTRALEAASTSAAFWKNRRAEPPLAASRASGGSSAASASPGRLTSSPTRSRCPSGGVAAADGAKGGANSFQCSASACAIAENHAVAHLLCAVNTAGRRGSPGTAGDGLLSAETRCMVGKRTAAT